MKIKNVPIIGTPWNNYENDYEEIKKTPIRVLIKNLGFFYGNWESEVAQNKGEK